MRMVDSPMGMSTMFVTLLSHLATSLATSGAGMIFESIGILVHSADLSFLAPILSTCKIQPSQLISVSAHQNRHAPVYLYHGRIAFVTVARNHYGNLRHIVQDRVDLTLIVNMSYYYDQVRPIPQLFCVFADPSLRPAGHATGPWPPPGVVTVPTRSPMIAPMIPTRMPADSLNYVRPSDGLTVLVHDIRRHNREVRDALKLLRTAPSVVEIVIAQRRGVQAQQVSNLINRRSME